MANEPYQPINVNTGSAQQAIQATPNVTPNLEGLMQGIQSGFISADDIRKRVQSGPLEAATRTQDLADVQQVRPLQREAAVAQLPNVVAKEKFVAESLPILQAQGRITLAQDFENAKQNGAPDAILKSFYASVPGLIPWDPEKLTDKKTGQVNLAYAIDLTQKAHVKAAQIAAQKPILVENEVTDKFGNKTSSKRYVDMTTGETRGVAVPTGSVAAKQSDNVKEFKSSRINKEGTFEEEVVYRLDGNGNMLGETVLGTKPIKLTQEQANALQFSDRMGFNNTVVSDLSTKGFDPTAIKTTVQTYLPNRFQPEALQSYTAAKDNWITAALRKESGAAISPTEYTHANKEYFPRDGDTPAVVKQKEALRTLAEEDIRLSTPGAGFWNPGGRNKNTAAPAATAPGAPAAPAAPVTPGTPAPIPTVQTPAEAAALPSTVQFFKTPTGTVKLNPNFRP